MKNTKEHIDETILLKIIEQRADENEHQIFQHWINASEMHAEAFEEFKKIHQLTSIDTIDKHKNWESIVRKVNAESVVPGYIELPRKTVSTIPMSLKTMIRVAAMLIIVIGVSFLVKNIVFNNEQLTISSRDLKPHEPYLLADGSSVYLNGNSEITFSGQFGKKDRELSLKGEAFFEVQPNKKLPFIITSGKTKTQVVGTSFNVSSDSLGNVKVSVVTGIVAFYSNKKEDGVKLTEGEQAVYHSGLAHIEKEPNTDPNFLSWKTGILYFKETPINEAFQLLQKQYSRVFVFETNESVLPTLTTTIDNESEEAVLEELNLLLNTKNVIVNDTIFFKPNN